MRRFPALPTLFLSLVAGVSCSQTETGGVYDLACKGRWSDDHTFGLTWTRVGDNQRYEVTFSFQGREAALVASSSTLGVVDRMTGSQLQ